MNESGERRGEATTHHTTILGAPLTPTMSARSLLPMTAPLDIDRIRARFPGLVRRDGDATAVFFDGAAGSQVPGVVADAVAGYLLHRNANTGGAFATARATDEALAEAQRAAADWFGADDPDAVVFGPNMTTLTFMLSRALARTWQRGDEILLTRLDHDANVTPWVRAAASVGATVRFVPFTQPDCALDLDAVRHALSPRTRLFAFTAASNLVGTLTPVKDLVRLARAVGAQTFVDAVHYAPHQRIDVAAWGCDFAVCSPYKFFGPHAGLLFGRAELLSALDAEKVRPAKDTLPHRFMTGTANHEAIVGTAAAVDYLADLGREVRGMQLPRRAALDAAFAAIGAHERDLCARLLAGLAALPDVRIVGIADPARTAARAPTVAFTHRHVPARQLAEVLAEHGIYTWGGNAYAIEVTTALGLEPDGVLRAGVLHYNTTAEVDRMLAVLATLTQ